MKISIIIPAYKAEESLKKLFDRIQTLFAENLEYEYEIILVFDGGNKSTWGVIQEIKKANPRIVKAIRLSRNFGQHNALICGIKNASGKFIVTMDEDLQHEPEDIIRLLAKQKEDDYDLVYGKLKQLKHSPFRIITSKTLKSLIQIGIPGLHKDYSPYRLIKA